MIMNHFVFWVFGFPFPLISCTHYSLIFLLCWFSFKNLLDVIYVGFIDTDLFSVCDIPLYFVHRFFQIFKDFNGIKLVLFKVSVLFV